MGNDAETVVHKILGKIWPGRKPTATGQASSTAESSELSAFETRLNKILKSHSGTAMKDHVYLIDLSKIRDRLGDKWTNSLDKIHIKTDSILKAQIAARDLFIRRDDVSYLVVFDALPRLQGHLKANMLNEEIARALVGVEEAPSLTSVMDVTIDQNGEVTLVNTPSKDQLIAELVSKADHEREEKPAYQSPMMFEDVDFIYRPMLVTKSRVVSTYVCIPIRPSASGQNASGYDVIGNAPSAEEIFELDHFTQHVAAQELDKLLKAHSHSLIALPVHFETLAAIKRRMKYLSNIETVMKDHHERIIFEMVGLPENIPQPRILELTSALRGHSRAIIARFSADHGNFPAYRTAGLHAVGIDVFNPNKSEKLLIKDMETFVDNARQNQLRTYAHGVRSISLLTAAMCAGFDYLDGYALSSVVTGALDIKGFSLAAPYKAYINQMKEDEAS